MNINCYVQARLDAVRNYMRQHKLDAILVTDNLDQLYLTDFFFYKEEAILLIHNKGMAAVTRSLYVSTFAGYAPHIHVWGEDGDRVQALLAYARKLGLKRVGFDSAKETYPVGKLLRQRGFVEIPSIISSLRETKDTAELRCLRASNRLAYLTYEYIKPRIKTGMSECEVAADMERFMRIHGSKTPSFFTIVAFGENTANPHHETSSRLLKANDAVLLDFGCVLNNYCSDMTRSWWHGNNEPAQYAEIWGIVETARKAGIKAAKPGVKCQTVDGTSRDIITQAGYGPYFTHGTGHGVGLEVHENPYNSQTSHATLQAGNVVTVEPGIYLSGKYGVRLEDTIAITQTGARILTRK